MEITKTQEGRVFEIKESEFRKNTMQANLSTYEGKDKEDKARYSSWTTYFVGNAYEKAKALSEKDEIILTNAKVDNVYDKEKQKVYINLTVFDFEKKERE